MNMRANIGIVSLGHYLPTQSVDNHTFVRQGMDTSHEWIVARSGIESRHIAFDHEQTSDLATKASQHALSRWAYTAQDIDFIIVATATPDHTGFPSTACMVQHKLGLSHAITAFDIAAACSGFTYGLSIAKGLIQSGQCQYGLVIGAETLSRITDWNDRSTCVLFGDGAGAAIVGPVSHGGILSIDQGANGADHRILTVNPSENTADFSNTHHPHNRPVIHMDGKSVFKQGIHYAYHSFIRALNQVNMTATDLQYIIPHQANIRMMEHLSQKLHVSMDQFLINIDSVGNTSAASIPIVLSNHADTFNAGDTMALLGFGAGFTWSSVILEWSTDENN